MSNNNDNNKDKDSHFKGISKENLQKLKEQRNMLNQYISLKNGESVDLEFDPNRVENITNKFGQERTRFYVYDPEFDGEFIWDAPRSAARQITDMMLQQGTKFFHIERHGEAKETRYIVTVAK